MYIPKDEKKKLKWFEPRLESTPDEWTEYDQGHLFSG